MGFLGIIINPIIFMNIISIIPSRGGSKGIPKKNIKNMNGVPLIVYTIKASLTSTEISRTIVSTDDLETAEIAKNYGAEVPFLRPYYLAKDNTPDYPVVEHCINYLEKVEGWFTDIVVYLRPTMPLRSVELIDKCVRIFKEKNNADSLRTVRDVPYPPFWMKKIDEKGYVKPFIDEVSEYANCRRQDLPRTVICDGYVDISFAELIIKKKQVTPGNVLAVFNNSIPFVDIDTIDDWNYCEYLIMNSGENEYSNI